LLLVLRLRGGTVHSIFVEVSGEIAEKALAEVAFVLNERLSGLTLREIRTTIPARLRDARAGDDAGELLNIFIQEGEQLFDVSAPLVHESVLLGQTSHLAEQPEFASGENMRRLLALTDRPEALGELLRKRSAIPGITITIGREHNDPSFAGLTVVTAEYHAGALAGVIGVIGPTRMPYEKVISLVAHTSRLISDLL
jgi:heat-inducible transcriptional repressor